MLDIEDFDQVYAFDRDYAYPDSTRREILQRRKELKQLFFDRLLKTLHVKATADHKPLYPPSSNAHLRQLHSNILSAPIPQHHKQSLLYYLLLDTSPSPPSAPLPTPSPAASAFAASSFLPPRYATATLGLWHLDRLALDAALACLCDPSQLPTFGEDVLALLLGRREWARAFAYWTAAAPPVAPGNAGLRGLLLEMLLRAGLHEALAWLRGIEDAQERRAGFERLVEYALGPEDGGRERAMLLLDLPLTDEEEGWFEEVLLKGSAADGKRLHRASETLLMRRLALGKVEDAMRLREQLPLAKPKKVSVGVDELTAGLRKTLATNGLQAD